MNKKIILAFLIILSTDAFSQCISLNNLFELSQVSLEQKDKVLDKFGFRLSNPGKIAIETFGPEWYNEETDNYITVKIDDDNIFLIGYRLKNNMKCFDKLISEAKNNNYKKDFEDFNEYNTLRFYYSNDKYGIIFSKWKSPNGFSGHFYDVDILDKRQYQIEINK